MIVTVRKSILIVEIPLTVLLVSSAIFVLSRSRSLAENKSFAADFQRLVAILALVLCCCQSVSIGVYFYLNYAGAGVPDSHLRQQHVLFFSLFASIFNSGINLFIYIGASKSFRKSFFQCLSFQ